MKQWSGKVLCAARGCARLATVKLIPPQRTSGRELSPVYYCSTHAQAGPHATAVLAHLAQESLEYALWMRLLSSSAQQEKLRLACQFLLTFL